MGFQINTTPSGAVYTKGGTRLASSKIWRQSAVRLLEFENSDSFEIVTVSDSVAFSYFSGYNRIRLFGEQGWADWEPGCMVSAPGWEQRLEGVGQSRNAIVSIAPSLVEALMDSPVESLEIDMVRAPRRDLRVIQYLISTLRADAALGSPSNAIFAESVAIALLQTVCSSHVVRRAYSELPHSVIGRVPDFINENLAEDLSLSRIATVTGVNIRQLTGAFRASYGQSIHQYVIRRRLGRAISLLRLGIDIADVAALSGFDSPKSVSRSLRLIFGISASAIRY